MDCLIFGASGYLGSRIFDHLISKKVNLTIGKNNSQNGNFSEYKVVNNYISLKIKELISLTDQYDLIIDCSGISSPNISKQKFSEIIEINSFWPIRLAEACIKTNTRLIWFSTSQCEGINIFDQKSLKENFYGLSKIFAENSIMEIKDWDKYVSIVRLGNMIGSPGSIYSGNSNLFHLDISRNLVLYKKALIKSNPNNSIGFVAIPELLNSKIFQTSGFFKLYSQEFLTLFSIAKYILESYEKISGEVGEIAIKNIQIKPIYEPIPKNIKDEINLMIKFFYSMKKFRL